MSDRKRTANEIQWRNIRKVVRTLADLCFESPEHPKYGTYHTALTTSLTAKDGLGPIDLEPLPDTATLTAELARVKAERDSTYDEAENIIRRQREEINKIKAERDAALRDAERYRWLRNKTRTLDFSYGTASSYVSMCRIGTPLDAAIDAAREG